MHMCRTALHDASWHAMAVSSGGSLLTLPSHAMKGGKPFKTTGLLDAVPASSTRRPVASQMASHSDTVRLYSRDQSESRPTWVMASYGLDPPTPGRACAPRGDATRNARTRKRGRGGIVWSRVTECVACGGATRDVV
jgi:hypothetical protein